MSQLARKCVTRDLKKRGRFPRSEKLKAAQLFSGNLHFISVTFGGGIKVPDGDLAVAIQYAAYAVPVLSDYCSQYGPNTVNVDTSPILFSFNGTSFSDATLQSWVRSIAQTHNIPAADCLVFLSPNGVTNTDAPISQGVLGYHGFTGTHPYCFVNVLGTGLTIADRADVYASALSHEIGEMIVDPLADLSGPEDSDSCSGNCLPSGTLVVGDNKAIEEYARGDSVVGASGFQAVEQTYKRDFAGDLITLKALGLLPFQTTDEHPIMMVKGHLDRSGKHVEYSDRMWKAAHQVDEGDYLVMPRLKGTREDKIVDLKPNILARKELLSKPNKAHFKIETLPLNTDVAWLLGMYVAEGCASIERGTGRVIFTLSQNESTTVERLVQIIRSLGYSPYTKDQPNSEAIQVRMTGLPLAMGLREICGDDCYTKKIPDSILLHKDEDILKSFLEGYMEGDGCTSYSHGFKIERFSTSSQCLAQQLQLAFGRLGIFVTLQHSRLPENGTLLGRKVNLHDQYTGEFGRLYQRHLHGDNYYLKVKSIEKTPYKGTVYNLRTQDNTYLVSNAVVHNCGVDYRNYFDSNSTWLGGSSSQYLFFTQGIATPAQVNACPSPMNACTYQPPGTASPPVPTPTPTPTPHPTDPCLAEIKKGITELETGHILAGIEDIVNGLFCYLEHGLLGKATKEEAEKILHRIRL